jgi:PAS domain S-box-containing protein
MFPVTLDNLFTLALVLNAIFFIPQIIRVVRNGNSENVSIVSFVGFWFIQLVVMFHGYFHQNSVQFFGALLSLAFGGSLLICLFIYRDKSWIVSLPQSADFFKSIIEKMPGNAYWMNRDGIFLGCNDNMLKQLGLKTRSQYIGKTYEDLYDQQKIQSVKETDMRVMSENKPETIEETVMPYGAFLTQKIPLHNIFGVVSGLLGISMDITDRKEFEQALALAKDEAERLSAEQASFIQSLRHDVRMPATTITSLSNKLNDCVLPESAKNIANDLALSSKAMLEFLNEILDDTVIEHEGLPLRNVPIHLDQSIHAVMHMVVNPATDKGLTLNLEVDGALPRIVFGDASRFKRLLLNLLSTAIERTEKGGVLFTARVVDKHYDVIEILFQVSEESEKPAQSVSSVTNAGSWMLDPDDKTSIALVKRYVREMGGRIDIHSSAQDHQLTCVLPFRVADEA